MNKQILISLSVIGAVAAIAVGGTVAYFSDTETSSGNTLTAGTLDLKVNGYDDPVPAVVTIGDMKPSMHKETDWIKLNIYNNPGNLYKHILLPECGTGTMTEPECTEQGGVWKMGECIGGIERSDLYNHMWFDLTIWVDADGDGNIDEEEMKVLIPDEKVQLEELISKWIYLGEYGEYGTPPLVPPVYVKQSFHLKHYVTNWAQGDVCTFSEQFMVLQTNAGYPENCYDPITGDECGD